MAVLNKIRQRSVFLIIIIALALFSFVLADVIRNGGMASQSSQNTIATVNGNEIGREEFAREVEAFERNMGNNMSTTQAVNRIWEQKLRQVILEEEVEKLGIRAGEAQVTQLVRTQMANNPNFTNEAGMFDENRLREYVANLKETSPQAYEQWQQFTSNLAETAKMNSYYNMVGAGVGATLIEGEQAYRLQNDNINMKFVQVPYSSVPDSEVEVTKSDIKSYLDNHSSRFETEASRSLQYVIFEESASGDDKTEAKETLNSLRNQRVEYNAAVGANDTLAGFDNTDDYATFVGNNSDLPFENRFKFRNDFSGNNAEAIFSLNEGETYGPYEENGYWKLSKVIQTKNIPDSVKASHILVTYQGSQLGAGVSRSKEEAQVLADSIAGVVKGDNAKFAELASEFSADGSNKEQGGDLGYFVPGTMIPAFDNYVFDNSTGDVGVVETPLGYHVISIDDQTEAARAVKVATIAKEIQASEKTMNNLFNEVTKFEISASEGDFGDIAKQGNYEVRTVKDVKALEENIPGAGAQRRVIQWAFEDEAKVGDVRRFETNNGYVVAQLTSKRDKGLMSVEEASGEVTPILRKEKKAKLIKDRLKGSSLQEIANNQGVSVQNADAVNLSSPTLAGAGEEPEVVGAVFSLEPGKVSSPIAGEKGVYVAELVSKFEAPTMDSYKGFAQQESAARRAQATMRIFDALKKKAEIEDNRARFY
ncbi:peptidylprolyl isomerase [Christiangramia forsetii]|uniref:Periplasmic chaperone PpiD n=2 Tax=Christiangramia forsetii TaxID=411153 RepID=A0M5M7_CHRFK|nr:peptidylprolyl isomerase [Christiangramia forsetii]GGG32566.1 peptidylprolyl isomerase [Christiangramia forsetii]CAL67922.1 PpiC-type secreted peptidyl-prolyl cis-trans isomerase [Christiangramia forsetii KT0803]